MKLLGFFISIIIETLVAVVQILEHIVCILISASRLRASIRYYVSHFVLLSVVFLQLGLTQDLSIEYELLAPVWRLPRVLVIAAHFCALIDYLLIQIKKILDHLIQFQI